MIDSQQTIIPWLVVFLASSGVCIAAVLWKLSRLRGDSEKTVAAAKSAARAFHQRVSYFTSQVRTLDEHANEYTSIFSSDAWGNLVETVSRLEQFDLKAQALVRSKRYGEVKDLLSEFYSDNESELVKLQSSLDSYKASADWELNVHAMLKRVVQNLEAATHDTKELNRSVTSRKRQPTLVTLADVKKTLLEEEVFRRSVERGPE
jgi:hypothetical protein